MVEVWFFYILAAIFFWAINSLVDKLMLGKHLSAVSYFFCQTAPKAALIIGILIFMPIRIDLSFFAFTLIAAAIGVLSYYSYAFGLKDEELSRIYSLQSLYPAFVAIFSAIFLSEIFQPRFYLGIALMLVGTFLITYKFQKSRKFIPLLTLAIVLSANIFIAIEQTMSKIVLNSVDLWSFLAAYMIGNVLTTLPFLFTKHAKIAVEEIKNLGVSRFFTIQTSISLWVIAIVIFFYAASLAPVTLVSTLSIMTPLVILLMSLFVSKFFPRFFKEQIDKKTVALKLLAIVLIFLGTYLIVV